MDDNIQGRIDDYLDQVFASAEDSPSVAELRIEVRHDLLERLADLLERGVGDEIAYAQVISSIGDIESTIAELAEQDRVYDSVGTAGVSVGTAGVGETSEADESVGTVPSDSSDTVLIPKPDSRDGSSVSLRYQNQTVGTVPTVFGTVPTALPGDEGETRPGFAAETGSTGILAGLASLYDSKQGETPTQIPPESGLGSDPGWVCTGETVAGDSDIAGVQGSTAVSDLGTGGDLGGGDDLGTGGDLGGAGDWDARNRNDISGTVHPEPIGTVRTEPIGTVHPEPTGAVRTEPTGAARTIPDGQAPGAEWHPDGEPRTDSSAGTDYDPDGEPRTGADYNPYSEPSSDPYTDPTFRTYRADDWVTSLADAVQAGLEEVRAQVGGALGKVEEALAGAGLWDDEVRAKFREDVRSQVRADWASNWAREHSRMARTFAASDLRNANFQGQDLTGGNFVASSLRNSCFSESILVKCNLRAADLRGVDFTRADLTGAALTSCSLRGAQFGWANLTDAVMSMADLRRVEFTGTALVRTKLTYADLRDARFRDCRIEGTNFAGADLRRACFDGLLLSGVKFDSANVSGTSFRGTTLRWVSFNRVSRKAIMSMICEDTVLDEATFASLRALGYDLPGIRVEP